MSEGQQVPDEVWSRLGPVWVRGLDYAPAGRPAGTVLLLPGLGLPRYTLPTVEELAGRGLRCLVFDVLASRRQHPRVPPDVVSIGQAAARWTQTLGLEGPLVVFGHSTGAQAGLVAALRLQDVVKPLSVVLAGPTFQPQHRSVPGLLRAAATAYRHDTPRELVVLQNLARVRTDVVRITQSARRDRPEVRIARLRVPLLLTAGEDDSFASVPWMQRLAMASASPSALVVSLPGSHNNLYTHPDAVAAEVVALVASMAS